MIRRSREIAATVVHVPKRGDRMKKNLAQLVHDDLSPVQRQRAGTPCPARGCCLLPERATNTARLSGGYVGCGVTDHTAKQVRRIYRKRLDIETTYWLIRQVRGVTTTRDPVVRFAFAFMLVAASLENLWLVLRWGRRELPEKFTFPCFAIGFRRSWRSNWNGGG